MFSKNKIFLFQQPLQNTITRKIDQQYKHATQVIIYGSLANDVMQDIMKKHKELTVNDQRDIYAFEKIVEGNIGATLTVSCKSNINYQETRKKKHKNIDKKIDCKHDDDFKDNKTMHSSHISTFRNCEPQFDTSTNTIIYIVGKDEEEGNAILDKLKDIHNMENHAIILCIIYDKDVGVRFNCNNNSKLNVINYATYSVHTMEKDIFERIEKSTDSYFNNLINEEINKIKTELLQGFQNTLDEKADEFFEEKSGCLGFR